MTNADVVGRVVKILGGGRAVANIGLEVDVHPGDLFAVFELGEEITDPETGESLGVLEVVKGTLVAEHVQPKLTQLGPPPEAAPTNDTRVLSAQMADPAVGYRPSKRQRPVRVGDRVRRVGTAH